MTKARQKRGMKDTLVILSTLGPDRKAGLDSGLDFGLDFGLDIGLTFIDLK